MYLASPVVELWAVGVLLFVVACVVVLKVRHYHDTTGSVEMHGPNGCPKYGSCKHGPPCPPGPSDRCPFYYEDRIQLGRR